MERKANINLVYTNDRRISLDKGVYAGIDEAGVSSIAGPMVGAVIVLPKNHYITELPVDSKNLEPKTVQKIAKKIYEEALFIQIFEIEANEVDRVKADPARFALWSRIAHSIRRKYPNITIILDGKHEIKTKGGAPLPNHEAVIKADSIYDNVSAAGIIAKAHCDNQMKKLHDKYQRYNFAKHKGYPTVEHLKLIKQHGISPVHRKRMTQKMLKEKRTLKEEANLSLDELNQKLKEFAGKVKKHPEALDEWGRRFLRQQYRKVIHQNSLPTPRQQYFIIKEIRETEKKIEQLKRIKNYKT